VQYFTGKAKEYGKIDTAPLLILKICDQSVPYSALMKELEITGTALTETASYWLLDFAIHSIV